MISTGHPFHFVRPILEDKPGTCHFSKYVYAPDSLFDQRTHLQIETSLWSPDWLSDVIRSLRTDEELAFHSTFIARGRTWHVPMIDFAPEPKVVSAAMDRLRMYLPRLVFKSMALFKSGRSLHAYSAALLSPREWLDFKGRLLLANVREKPELIDTRWVGHRLIGGFSALRWSCNTAHYLEAPHLVQIPR